MVMFGAVMKIRTFNILQPLARKAENVHIKSLRKDDIFKACDSDEIMIAMGDPVVNDLDGSKSIILCLKYFEDK